MNFTPKDTQWRKLEYGAIRAFNRVGSMPRVSLLICVVLGFSLPALFGSLQGFPEPQVHDEYSFWLAADTFASGRVTNPTHEMWQHFESPHILQRPSYMSKYPPGQGLMMALGQRVFGHPAYGVWLSVGLAAGCLCWMLQGWTRSRWAFLGTLLFIFALGVTHGWAQSYWGGMVAVAGGALLLGGLRRAMHRPTIGSSLALAAGLLLLGNTRPFEGALVALFCLIVFVTWFAVDRRLDWKRKALRTIVPVVVVLLCGLGGMLFYNYRVTGAAFRLPYSEHQSQYFRAPLFVLQSDDKESKEGHPRLRAFYDQYGTKVFGKSYFFTEPRDLLRLQIEAFLGIAMVAPILIAMPWLIRDRWFLLAMGAWLFLVLAMSWATFSRISHYAAPIACVAYLMLAASLRRLRLLHTGSGVLPRLKCRYILVLLAVLWIAGEGPKIAKACYYALRQESIPAVHFSRQPVVDEVSATDGPHLIIVSYGPEYSLHNEWVYNRADIDAAKIVWAHDLGEKLNEELRAHFSEHHVWRLHVTNSGADLTDLSENEADSLR